MVFAVTFVVLMFDQHGIFQSIYTDYIMALITVYLFMVILTSQKITWFETASIMLGGSFLLLLKQMGLPLYLMAVCFFCDNSFKKGKIQNKRMREECRCLEVDFGTRDASGAFCTVVYLGESNGWRSKTI